MSRPRAGAFTDAETLALHERGATVRELAELEQCTPNAIAARLKRARAAGALQTDVLAGLRAAIERLEVLERAAGR